MPIGLLWQTLIETPAINAIILLSALSFGSYGFGILVFTVITRGLAFPLQLRTMRATRRMTDLQPEIQALQKKYSDPRRRSEETFKLYRRKTLRCEAAGVATLMQGSKVECDWHTQSIERDELIADYAKHLERVHGLHFDDAPEKAQSKARKSIEGGVNPAGCLGPMVIQMPIFIALYAVIRFTNATTPEEWMRLSHRLYDWGPVQSALPLSSTFLGMDLHGNGPIPLAILVGASMWLTQRISTGRNASPAAASGGSQQADVQRTMLWVMPPVFGYMTTLWPAGLGLYWAASSIIGLVLQWIFLGPGDFTWGSLVPPPVRNALGWPPAGPAPAHGRKATATAGAGGGGSNNGSDGSADPEGGSAEPGTGGEDEGRGGERANGGRRRRSRARSTRGESRSRRRRRDPGG